MSLSIHNSQDGLLSCGANGIEVKLKQGSTTCQTKNHGSGSGFDRGETLYWNDLGNCDTTEFNLDDVYINFYLKANSGDNYCPNRFSVEFKAVGSVGRASYKSEDIDKILDHGNNENLFRATREGKLIKVKF